MRGHPVIRGHFLKMVSHLPHVKEPVTNGCLVCWSLTSLCHSNGHIETMPAREINPFTALTRIRSQFLRTQWLTSNHQRVDMTTPQTAQPSGLACDKQTPVMQGHFLWDIEVSADDRFYCIYCTTKKVIFGLFFFARLSVLCFVDIHYIDYLRSPL